jgi:predicted transcriptional regulator
MSKDVISFRIDDGNKEAVDLLAKEMDRDRSYVLNEAIRCYLEIQNWQVEHIKRAIAKADAGEFAPDEEVDAAFARWKQK